MVHVFVCYCLWSVCFPCRTSSVWRSVGCVVVIIWHLLFLFSSFSGWWNETVTELKVPACDLFVTFSPFHCLHTGLPVWLSEDQMAVLSSVCSNVCLRLVWNLLSHAHLFFSLFLTPMFVLLQDSVPMASPAFLLSLFVSIQGLPPISPDPGNAPYTLVSTQPHMRHIL